MLRSVLVACLALLPAVTLAAPAGRWPDLRQGLVKTGDGSADAALLVGVEAYTSLPAVQGATENVEDWYAYLTESRGLRPASVLLLRNQEASVERMRKGVAEARDLVGPGGTLWIVFVGHGALTKDGKDGLLIGADAQQEVDSLHARSLRQRELLSVIKGGRQGRSIVLLDACFSGRNRSGDALVPGLQPLVYSVSGVTKADLGQTILLTAAKSDQFAGDLPGAFRPAFSYLVLGALRGWADGNGDGEITAEEVADYAISTLRAVVRGRSQVPDLLAERAGQVLGQGRERAPDVTKLVLEGRRPAAGAEDAVLVNFSLPASGQRWSLRDAGGAVICQLPCRQWIASNKRYAVQREDLGGNEVVRVPIANALGFERGTKVDVAPRMNGSDRNAFWASLVGGIALGGFGVYGSAAGCAAEPTTTAFSVSTSMKNPGLCGAGVGAAALGVGALGYLVYHVFFGDYGRRYELESRVDR